jgi:hypothetical protein
MDIPSWSYLAVGQNLQSATLRLADETALKTPILERFHQRKVTLSRALDIQPVHVDKPEPIPYMTLSDFIPESNDIFNWIVNHFT